jgi:hypothetical protein
LGSSSGFFSSGLTFLLILLVLTDWEAEGTSKARKVVNANLPVSVKDEEASEQITATFSVSRGERIAV